AASGRREHELRHFLCLGPHVDGRAGRAFVRAVEMEIERNRQVPGADVLDGLVAGGLTRVGSALKGEVQGRGVELDVDRVADRLRLLVPVDRLELGLLERRHQSATSLRPSWAMCSSSIAISPVRALSCGPVTLAGNPRSNSQ